MMTMATKVAVSPAPPPTTNQLTAQQRMQLVRKTRKIEQLLGSTPRLIDMSVMTLDLPSVDSPSQVAFRLIPHLAVHTAHSPLLGGQPHFLCFLDRKKPSHGTTPVGPLDLALSEDWPYGTKEDILQLAFQSPPLETTPASTPGMPDSFIHDVDTSSVKCRQSTDSSTEVFPTNQPSLTSTNPIDNPSLYKSITVPMSTTPSPGCIRKQKMDRLRKRFGSGVPLDLVFPKIKSGPSENTPATRSRSSRSGLNTKEQPHLTATGPKQQAKTARGRSMNTRNSTTSLSDVISTSILHARTQSLGSPAASKQDITQKRPWTAPADKVKSKGRLSLIMECPEEHRVTHPDHGEFEHSLGCSCSTDETDSGSRCFAAVTSAKNLDDEGWHCNPARTAVDHETCPTTGIGSQPLKRPASAPSFVSRSSSWGSSGDSATLERKRRPSSYRKPPPPIPTELNCLNC